MEKTIPVVYAANDKYFPGLYVSMLSIIQYRKNLQAHYHFYVFYTQLSEDNLNRLNSIKIPSVQIHPLYISHTLFEHYAPDLYEQDYYSYEMYYRLLIPKLLPEHEKIIYLDSDVLVFGDLEELLAPDMGTHGIGAVADLPNLPRKQVIKQMLHLNPDNYFNSGVLLIQTKDFNRLRILERCMEIIRTRKDLLCPDQDALNLVCSNQIYYLEDSWNFQYGHTINNGEDLMDPETRYRYCKQKENWKILHYTAPVKPWNSLYNKYHYYFWMTAAQNPDMKDILFERNPVLPQRDARDILYQEFKEGKVGFSYIMKYSKAWLRYKIFRHRGLLPKEIPDGANTKREIGICEKG